MTTPAVSFQATCQVAVPGYDDCWPGQHAQHVVKPPARQEWINSPALGAVKHTNAQWCSCNQVTHIHTHKHCLATFPPVIMIMEELQGKAAHVAAFGTQCCILARPGRKCTECAGQQHTASSHYCYIPKQPAVPPSLTVISSPMHSASHTKPHAHPTALQTPTHLSSQFPHACPTALLSQAGTSSTTAGTAITGCAARCCKWLQRLSLGVASSTDSPYISARCRALRLPCHNM